MAKYIIRCISLCRLGKLCDVKNYGLVFVPIYGYVKESEIYSQVGKIIKTDMTLSHNGYRWLFVILSVLNKFLGTILYVLLLYFVVSMTEYYPNADMDFLFSIIRCIIAIICFAIYFGVAFLKAYVLQERLPSCILAFIIPNCFGFYVYSQVKKELDVLYEQNDTMDFMEYTDDET